MFLEKIFFYLFLFSIFFLTVSCSKANNQIPLSSPMLTDTAGKGGTLAASSVVRVACPKLNSIGTGFIYAGDVITAAHIVSASLDLLGKKKSREKVAPESE